MRGTIGSKAALTVALFLALSLLITAGTKGQANSPPDLYIYDTYDYDANPWDSVVIQGNDIRFTVLWGEPDYFSHIDDVGMSICKSNAVDTASCCSCQDGQWCVAPGWVTPSGPWPPETTASECTYTVTDSPGTKYFYILLFDDYSGDPQYSISPAYSFTVTDTCSNLVQDGDETDVDCGGSCPGCGIGKGCDVNADCQSGNCVGGPGGTCQAAAPPSNGGAPGFDMTLVNIIIVELAVVALSALVLVKGGALGMGKP